MKKTSNLDLVAKQIYARQTKVDLVDLTNKLAPLPVDSAPSVKGVRDKIKWYHAACDGNVGVRNAKSR